MRVELPLDPWSVSILRLLDQSGAGYFLVGAMAREVLLTHVYGLPAGRATNDMDFAIAVADWAEFHLLRERLLAAAPQMHATRVVHRLAYRVVPSHGAPWDYHIDIIPFAGVEDGDRRLSWPPTSTCT